MYFYICVYIGTSFYTVYFGDIKVYLLKFSIGARLIKESTEDGKVRMKLELDVKVLQEQIRALKKSNQDLAQRSKEEASGKVKVTEEAEQLHEKLKTMDSRLSFLLNKVQMDEEGRIIMTEDRKKLEAQVMSYTEKCKELQKKLLEMGESNRIITQAMRLKQEEVSEISARYDVIKREMDDREARDAEMDFPGNKHGQGGSDDVDNGRLNEGRVRFFVDAKAIPGGSLLLLKGRKPSYKEWLDKHNTNEFLKRAQKSQRFKDIMVEKIAHLYSLLMVEEEEKLGLAETIETRNKSIEHLQNKMVYIQDGLAVEEDAKRRMLLRYIHSVKEQASSSSDGAGGVLQLPESNISDEEIHALAALLRNNTNIEELNLRGNIITDDGARALGAVLAGKSALRLIDLRGNRIGKGAIRILAEALERSERVRHVYVHAGGKIEALGTNPDRLGVTGTGTGGPNEQLNTAVETVCVVDVRDNAPSEASQAFELLTMERNFTTGQGKMEESTSNRNNKFTPIMLLESNGAPSKGVWDPSTITGGGLGGLTSSTGGKIKDLIMKKKRKKLLKSKNEQSPPEQILSAEKKKTRTQVCSDEFFPFLMNTKSLINYSDSLV